jgi:hypothetical protein
MPNARKSRTRTEREKDADVMEKGEDLEKEKDMDMDMMEKGEDPEVMRKGTLPSLVWSTSLELVKVIPPSTFCGSSFHRSTQMRNVFTSLIYPPECHNFH